MFLSRQDHKRYWRAKSHVLAHVHIKKNAEALENDIYKSKERDASSVNLYACLGSYTQFCKLLVPLHKPQPPAP